MSLSAVTNLRVLSLTIALAALAVLALACSVEGGGSGSHGGVARRYAEAFIRGDEAAALKEELPPPGAFGTWYAQELMDDVRGCDIADVLVPDILDGDWDKVRVTFREPCGVYREIEECGVFMNMLNGRAWVVRMNCPGY